MAKAKSKKSLRTKTWNLLSRYTRLKHADQDGFVRCITCQKSMRWQDAHAGHFIPQGRGNRARFCYNKTISYNGQEYHEVWNMFPQCASCNVGGYGKVHLYSLKMLELYGEGICEAMEWYCRQTWNMREADYLAIQEDVKQRLIELGD